MIRKTLASIGIGLSLLLVGAGTASAATTYVSDTVPVAPGEVKTVTASCPAGTSFAGISTSAKNVSAIEYLIANKLTARLKGGKTAGTYTYKLTCKS